VNLKKASITLRIQNNEVSDYYKGSLFGVPALDPDVLRLWTEYNALLEKLKEFDEELFTEFYEIKYPAPYVADEDSFYKEGTMIYKPEHFVPLKQAVENLLDAIVPLVWKRESA
jgi:hypothetical protein